MSKASQTSEQATATPDTAAVRICVIDDASITARRLPVSVSKSSTAPWCESYLVLLFFGSTVMSLAPTVDGFAIAAGITANAPSGIGNTVRSGMVASPRASAESVSAMSSMHLGIVSRRTTSESLRTSMSRRVRVDGMGARLRATPRP